MAEDLSVLEPPTKALGAIALLSVAALGLVAIYGALREPPTEWSLFSVDPGGNVALLGRWNGPSATDEIHVEARAGHTEVHGLYDGPLERGALNLLFGSNGGYQVTLVVDGPAGPGDSPADPLEARCGPGAWEGRAESARGEVIAQWYEDEDVGCQFVLELRKPLRDAEGYELAWFLSGAGPRAGDSLSVWFWPRALPSGS